jgi:hypothetical protein
MSTRRQNQAELVCVWNDLVSAWSEEGAESEENASVETGVFARRPPRDSYTQERPLLSASWDVHADDLLDEGAAGNDIHLLRTLRP